MDQIPVLVSYIQAHPPLIQASTVCLISTGLAHGLALLTKNYSWVDRAWSLLPVSYAWTLAGDDVASRMVAGLITLWGIRLTGNFIRQGGYNFKEEDYRWPVLRKIITIPILWHLFAILFIAAFQNILLFLIALPVHIITISAPHEWTLSHSLLTALFLLLWTGEMLADQHQYSYQTAKYAYRASLSAGAPKEQLRATLGAHQINAFDRGFCTSGLFGYSRHPNFFCELGMWWTVYAFSVLSQESWVNWTIVGPVLLTLLFQGSTGFTEWITGKKYPAYKVGRPSYMWK
ncbi:hypothetical protein DFS34DRAFT_576162 [Phlyctochytrium arcticum]|nr:hypothetical protein DFS34DRAFT_576162 [Phlyctochytrium arcticum]